MRPINSIAGGIGAAGTDCACNRPGRFNVTDEFPASLVFGSVNLRPLTIRWTSASVSPPEAWMRIVCSLPLASSFAETLTNGRFASMSKEHRIWWPPARRYDISENSPIRNEGGDPNPVRPTKFRHRPEVGSSQLAGTPSEPRIPQGRNRWNTSPSTSFAVSPMCSQHQ